MQFLRPIAVLLSLGLHAGVVFALVGVTSGGALDSGTGDDTFVVEQGISIEGVTNFGEAEEMIETVDIPPVQATEEPQEVKEIEPELTEVVTSTAGEHEAPVLEEEPEPVEEEKPVAVPVEEQAPQVATLVEKSSGAAQAGGDSTLRLAYLGTLRKTLERTKVNPRSRKTGTVLVRFTVGPSGNVISREVQKSSGSKVLDEAAIAALDRTSFPPMPDDLAGSTIEVQVPFKFLTR
jgi:periplasmic protein TonB